jgi:hypothetical protein
MAACVHGMGCTLPPADWGPTAGPARRRGLVPATSNFTLPGGRGKAFLIFGPRVLHGRPHGGFLEGFLRYSWRARLPLPGLGQGVRGQPGEMGELYIGHGAIFIRNRPTEQILWEPARRLIS